MSSVQGSAQGQRPCSGLSAADSGEPACTVELVFQVTAVLTCRFPGTADAYHALTECVDARLLMKAAIYTACHPEVCQSSSLCRAMHLDAYLEVRRHMHPIGACFMQAANNSYNMSNGRSGTRLDLVPAVARMPAALAPAHSERRLMQWCYVHLQGTRSAGSAPSTLNDCNVTSKSSCLQLWRARHIPAT